MKKTAVIVLVFGVITVWLTGCAKKTDPFPIQKEFTATVKCGEEMYTVTHNGTEITTVSYHSPEQLQGLTYSYCGDELTIKYGTLHYKPSAPLPENNISILHKVLSSINEQTEQYGDQRMLQVLNRDKDQPMEVILPDVRKDISNFVRKADQFDDITMLGFSWKSSEK